MRAEHTGPRDTTALYTRVTTKTIREIMSPLERLAAADPNNADRQRDLLRGARGSAIRAWCARRWH